MLEETRESIIRDNNTAQQSLEFLLEKVGPKVQELIFTDVLYGDLDFSVLARRGFWNVSKIHFTKPGKITSVANLPSSLVSFHCPNQLLVNFAGSNPHLEELNLDKNHISTIELAQMRKLKVLNLNENRISDIKNLPDSLEELYLNNSQVRLIDLRNTTKLRVLHANQNKMLRIQNVPPSVVDLQFEDNPMVDVEYSAMPNDEPENEEDITRNMDYAEGLAKYFKMKSDYETMLHVKRLAAFKKGRTRKQGMNLAKEYRPKCIKCARPFGTIFEQRDRRYIARCGNASSPCELNIQLYRGTHYPLEYMINLFHELVEETKEEVIAQKLDTLFSYISEKQSAEAFKELLKTYSIDNSILKERTNHYNELHYSNHKQELIRHKIRQIHDLKNAMREMQTTFQKENNIEILKSLMDIYIHEYLPEIHNLRLLNYEIMELNVLNEGLKTANELPIYQLFQRDVSLTKNDSITGEPPRVIAFRA